MPGRLRDELECVKARDLLGQTADLARRMGARPLANRGKSVMDEQFGAESFDEESPANALAALTARQREVAALLAEGLTNKEIAARLKLSPRTVDMHVSHVFDRLNVRTRAEAVGVLVQG